jgi:hypothetical protein
LGAPFTVECRRISGTKKSAASGLRTDPNQHVPVNTSTSYIPSRLLGGEAEELRRGSFTRWMSRDLTQAAADFCRSLGLYPAYCECSTEHLTRYVFWRPPSGAAIEVRTGRARDKFEELDRVNRERDWRLLTLHVNESGVHSAVWISKDQFGAAKAFLAAHGIAPARRRSAIRPRGLPPRSKGKAE